MDDDCTIYKTVDFIGKRWTLLILLELHKSHDNILRYSQIKKSLPQITPKILSSRLKELAEQEMISKYTNTTNVPIQCTYSLTKSGLDFITIIKDIKQWALKHKFKNKICATLDCKKCTL